MILSIGNSGSKSIGFDMASLVETRLLVQANSGGGKSWLLRRLLEQSHGHIQQIVIDLEGEFSTLRQKFDYVIAAKDGDTAAHPGSAKLLARRLLELRVSAICDIYELKAHDRIRFVRLFIESLMSCPRTLWHPVLIVLDEAHHFCPEKGQSEAAPAVIDVATRGRKRGFCTVLATQRLAKLHKDVCAETLNKLIGRTGLDIDQMRAADELGIRGKQDRLLLRTYKPGEFSVFGPALRVGKKCEAGVVKVFVGAVKSTHPSVGARYIQPPPAPTGAIKKVLGALRDLPEIAEKEIQDIGSLRKEVTRLKRELVLTEKKANVPGRSIKDNSEEIEILRRRLQTLKVNGISNMKTFDSMRKTSLAVKQGLEKLITKIDATADLTPTISVDDKSIQPIPTQSPKAINRPPRPIFPNAQVDSTESPRGAQDDFVTKSQKRIIDALLSYETLGLSVVHKNALAALAGVSPKSGGYFNNLGALRTAGLIQYPQKSHVCLTEIGRERGDSSIELNGIADLHEAWLNIVTLSQAKIITVVIDEYPNQIGKEDLADRVRVSARSGGYFNNLGRLRTLGVIDYPAPGQVIATSLLFPKELI